MQPLNKYLWTLFLVLNISLVTAHPGEDHSAEIAQRNAVKHIRRSLDHCSEKLKVRGHEQRGISRREATVKALRKERGLSESSLTKRIQHTEVNPALNISHHSNQSYTQNTPADILFASNSSCMLTPWSTEGPFYVEGELIRHDIREDQEGIDLVLELEWIDASTCEPIPNLYIDIWHANATGVYSGVAHALLSNGNNNDTTNLQNTFFRGVQPTDAYGIASFTSKLPGHYEGRATHIHLISHANVTVLPNGTYTGGNFSHVSQVYFDQDLLTAINQTAPYNTNTQSITLNTEDGILNGETVGSDPMLEYVLMGDSITDGVFAWKRLGIDVAPLTNVTHAAIHYASGDVMNDNDLYLSSYTPPFPPGSTLTAIPPML